MTPNMAAVVVYVMVATAMPSIIAGLHDVFEARPVQVQVSSVQLLEKV